MAREAKNTGIRVVEQYPEAERIDRAALLELPVELLCPCARYHSINVDNAKQVRAWAVCAGANDPVSPEAQVILADRGIIYLPDFVTNSGGVLGGTLEFAGVGPQRIARIIRQQIQDRVTRLMAGASEEGLSLRAYAEREALARHARVRAGAEHPSLMGRAVGLGVAAYRRCWIPATLMARVAPGHVIRRMDA
ncbi:MAG: hypothetical protein E4H18_05185 [Hyphomicrobiales bacterium]|nr:MAG: hypothetical protein E4H18_05185 [Hyphomicrobiales bacterium]